MVLELAMTVGIIAAVILAVWVFGAAVAEALRPYAVRALIELPQIGQLGCHSVTADTPLTQAFSFGKPGYNTMGCLASFVSSYAMVAVALVFAAGLLGAMLQNFFNPRATIDQWLRISAVSLIILFTIPIWPSIYDMIAGVNSYIGISEAAWPWGPTNSEHDMRRNAEQSIDKIMQGMRDASVGQHECIKAIDVDGDGVIDRTEADPLCVAAHIFDSDLLQAFLMFILTSFISIGLTLLVYMIGITRFLLTGILAVLFPLIVTLSRLPVVGRYFETFGIKPFIGLLFAPILIGAVVAAGPTMILHELTGLSTTSALPEDSIKIIGFIMWTGLALVIVTMYVGSASILGGALFSASMMIAGALQQVFSQATSVGGRIMAAGIGGDIGKMIPMATTGGLALSLMPGAGSGGGGGFGSNRELTQEISNGSRDNDDDGKDESSPEENRDGEPDASTSGEGDTGRGGGGGWSYKGGGAPF